MYFDSLEELLAMGGHGVYVWTAYLATLLVIMAVLIVPLRRRKRLLQQLAGEIKRSHAVPGGSTSEER